MAGAGKKGKKKLGGGMCGHLRPRRGILHVQVGRVKKKRNIFGRSKNNGEEGKGFFDFGSRLSLRP